MNLLLDTVAFLWILEGGANLSDPAKTALQDTENGVFLSSASAWEIALKYRLGKLPLPEAPDKLVPQQRKLRGIESLDINEASVLRLR